jgi:hypothetical protein
MREHLGFTLRKGKLPNPYKGRNGKVQTPEKLRKGNLPNPAKDKVCPDCGKKRLFAAHLQKCKEKLEKMVIQVDSPTAKQDVIAPDGFTVDSDNQRVNNEIVVEMDVDVVTVGGINGTGEMEINNSSKTRLFKKTYETITWRNFR